MAAYSLVSEDWKKLSEAASKERDPDKLMDLIGRLNEALQQREDRLRETRQNDPPKYS